MTDKCPFNNRESELDIGSFDTPVLTPGNTYPNAEQLREHLFDWYINSGFRGCLFNKVAAKDAREGKYTWETPVEYGTIEEITNGEAGQRVINTFEDIVGDGRSEGLVSYIFPALRVPEDYVKLLRFLGSADPERFRLLPIVDREKRSADTTDPNEYVGIPFRIKVGQTTEGEDALAYPMIYTPDEFTTFARRYDFFMITFNRFNAKQNPETPDTFIGVDDIDLQLSHTAFQALIRRSLAVNLDAHASGGKANLGEEQFNRKLFRAHNALVVPAAAWDLTTQ